MIYADDPHGVVGNFGNQGGGGGGGFIYQPDSTGRLYPVYYPAQEPYRDYGSGSGIPNEQPSSPSPSTALVPYQATLPATVNPVEQQAVKAISSSGLGWFALLIVLMLATNK